MFGGGGFPPQKCCFKHCSSFLLRSLTFLLWVFCTFSEPNRQLIWKYSDTHEFYWLQVIKNIDTLWHMRCLRIENSVRQHSMCLLTILPVDAARYNSQSAFFLYYRQYTHDDLVFYTITRDCQKWTVHIHSTATFFVTVCTYKILTFSNVCYLCSRHCCPVTITAK